MCIDAAPTALPLDRMELARHPEQIADQDFFEMFGPFRLHSELGGAVIVNPSEAAMFIQRLNAADKGKPHWRLAMSMIETAASSEEQEARAASAFATALRTEMWLED